MIPYEDDILPMSETPFNKALAALSTRLEGINAPTRQVWDPWTCPPDFLKALAHAFSVDLWVDSWTDTRKRSIIANAVRMHREKGTLAGARSYLRYVDARLIEAVTPPQKVYSGPALTREEREAWLAKLPQLRTWRVRERGFKGRGLFAGSAYRGSFIETGFTIPSTAIERLRRRARWVVGGVETDTKVTTEGSTFRLHIRGSAPRQTFSNTVMFGRYFQPTTAWKRLVTIAPATRLPWRSPVTPNLEAVTSEPERVVERGQRGRGVYSWGTMGKAYFVPTTAIFRIFWRFAINDGTHINRRPAIQFMGVGRYGFPAHTAHLKTSMPGKRKPWQAGEGIVEPGTRFWMPHNGERIMNTRRALVASKRVSDRIRIRYADRPQIIAGQMFRAGIDLAAQANEHNPLTGAAGGKASLFPGFPGTAVR